MQQQTSPAKVWFITGAARGIGLSLARQLLARGDTVAATSRTLTSLRQVFGDDNARLLALEVDLVNEVSVQKAINSTLAAFGHIDCVVNNAGYGQQGTIEALTDSELRRNFDVNVFAPLHVLRHALPHMRTRRSGHIFNVASIVGFQGGYAGWGSYVASKFALAGLTETLAAELAELNIRATVVYPGPVRTGFLSKETLVVAQRTITDYSEAQASLDLHLNGLDGKQAGNPDKVASLILQAASADAPPVHLFAGKIANTLAEQKMHAVSQDIDVWRSASDATDFEE
ncbi:TPA: SDR family oxidoreductase [Klebsiella pneumoniae]|uniref:SDR family oxidoreductase n=1 Tax=Enterobacteriaceae TaxID=543 RepID=UPI000A36551D|nr:MULTISPECIES: SDR family oxidoreductase [Enterobacteriaceae]EKW9964674.1 SDR family oxidoreductase [Pluralibacter gergoviae]HAV1579392.1 SDR family oxidoreductase [Enterobacter hormaechei subsp. steigerwaltii]HBT3293859.1 SDR family oxidoreductase [Klebsiella aerogenes]HCI6838266.1 SDR family oxidoreductase [Klebsiella quasipneumoniae subsp. quasipneumoniae]AZP33120.1 SDR family NAD(P)-dependent oxidoreductase [Cronobacter sakazakii]